MPNGGGGGPSSDGLVDLGGDNSIGRYCGGGVVTLGPLLRGHQHHRRAGARCRGAQRRGDLCGGTLPFMAKSRQIKCRMETRMELVSGLAILPLSSSLFLPLLSLVIFFAAFTQRLE
jgi:hypothetical protein